jgi:hypothetical protein
MTDPLTKEQIAAIAGALARGRQIEAIKLYREATGVGLKEAKDFVDALIPRLLAEDPQKYATLARTGGRGCAKVVLIALASCAAVAAAAAVAQALLR